jgi:hypothetical protein
MISKIDKARRSQPIEELERKARKAQSKNGWTIEEIDAADARAEKMLQWLNRSEGN